jgi:hypothetical protein
MKLFNHVTSKWIRIVNNVIPDGPVIKLVLYEDRIEIQNPDLVVPFESMIAIENMDEKKIFITFYVFSPPRAYIYNLCISTFPRIACIHHIYRSSYQQTPRYFQDQ